MRDAISDGGKSILRVGLGGLMLSHGITKLINFETMRNTFPDPIGLGSETGLLLVIGAEVGCAILLILGLFTRFAAMPLLFTMAVAIYHHLHRGDPFSNFELPLLYAIGYFAVMMLGAGSPSIDRSMANGVAAARERRNNRVSSEIAQPQSSTEAERLP